MFAMQPRGLFGQRKPFGTPGIGDGHREAMGLPPMGAPGMGMEAQPPRKMGIGSKLFGQGWEDKAFAIGGLLQGDQGAAAQAMRESQMKPLLEQQKRQAEYEDFVRKEKWKRANPTAPNNDTVADYEFIRQTLGEDEAQKFLKNKANPPLWRQGPDGQFYPMATGTVPTAPVGRLTPIDGGPQVVPAANFPRR